LLRACILRTCTARFVYIELRTIPAGKPHVVYLAVVQVASRGTPNI